MKKVISFSLWGNNTIYTIGAIKNVELAQGFFPDFECWFYIHKETVPKKIINRLSSFKNVKIILKESDLDSSKPMMWRYEAIDDPDVDIMMPRDTDTRILLREKMAVEEWMKSGKIFHIMRDHPCHHNVIMGGMFGTKKIPGIIWKNLFDYQTQIGNKQYDQIFLRKYIYNKIKNNCLVHASFHKHEKHSKDFPIPYCPDYHFVGEYVYPDENRPKDYKDMIINEFKKEGKL